MQRRRIGWKILICMAAVLVMVSAGGCRQSDSADDPDMTINDDQSILLHGLSTEDIEVSVAELKKLESETVKEKATRYGGETIEVSATGPLLDTLLKKYAVQQSDFNVIRFTAGDQYSIAVGQEILKNDKILLGYYNYNKPFAKEDGPVRVVIPNQRAMYWVRNLQRIDFESEDSAEIAAQVVFLESAVSTLDQVAYDADEQVGQAVKTKSLIDRYGGNPSAAVTEKKNVYMLAADGLQKNETKENFAKAYIKMTGGHAPKFTSPDLPEGMQVMDLLTIHYGKTAFFSMATAIKNMDLVNIDDDTGIPFSSVIKKVGSLNGDTYRFTGLHGQEVTLTFEELGNALLYLGEDGSVIFVPGVSGAERINGLLMIQAVQEEAQ